ncbi:hypothetical protein GCM10007424_08870 [Flavobacterium suaedae]|uniref:Uncharacterized protein n=1 Tax=Flavobacterium suaedae TaxID=1767027 RepID=A0ABQ1JP06_9FLAO|nr:hypothetical protein [Flavobacterium suaedae]GGB71089.1 hypothetical protein GCM10007424_08870 [Flavobacterium suaedae]
MKDLDVKLLLPYNWYHARRIKIFDDKGALLAKIAHGEELSVQIDQECKHITIRIDYIKSVIEVPQNSDKLFLSVYMNFRDRFPYKYIDSVKRKCITGKFMSKEEFENFNLDFYANAIEYLPAKKFDNASLALGFIIASGLIITSVVQQKNPFQDLLFFIGVASFISLLLVRAEKQKIQLYDYKSRLIATALAFVLAFFFLLPSFAVSMLFAVFISTFILRLITNLKTLNSA